MEGGQLFGWGQSATCGGLAPTWWRSEAEMNLYKTALAVFYLVTRAVRYLVRAVVVCMKSHQ